MKKKLHKYNYLLIICIAGTLSMHAMSGPPSPRRPPPPPGLPIDDGILFLGIAALTYGTHTIYNYTKKRKSLG